MKLTLDIETFSRVDLKKAGLYRYAEDESTDILCACYSFDDGPVHAWVPSADAFFVPENVDGKFHFGPDVPYDLRQAIEGGSIIDLTIDKKQRVGFGMDVHAWNAMFERRVLAGPAGWRYNFPKLAIQQMRCSMHRARVHGLPGALENAAEVLGAAVQKRKTGQNAMRYLCKPRKDGSQSNASNEYERFVQLVAYCADDVRAERACDDLVPELTKEELRVYFMDQQINDRGWKVDVAAVENLIDIVRQYKERLVATCFEMTGYKPTQRAQIAAWIREHGVPDMPNMQADTIRKLLLTDIPAEAKKLMKLYSTYNMKAVAKLPVMLRALCRDGRIHGMFLIYGAGTGRWSSIIVQLQNLLRPVIEDPDVAIEMMALRDLDWLRALYTEGPGGKDPMKVVASCIRGMLIAEEGYELVFPDFSGVEARWNAWMFGEEWKLEAYRAYDADPVNNPNLYCVIFGQCFNVDPMSPRGKAGKQIGKVLDLSMGYEGGVGAFIKMAANYGINLTQMAEDTFPTLPRWVVEEATNAWQFAKKQGRTYDLAEKVWVTCDALKRLWRKAHPKIVAGWAKLKEAAILATENPGTVYKVAGGRIMFKVKGRWLYMRLPSGRRIAYYKPEVKTVKRKGMVGRNGQPVFDKVFYYYGINTVTRQYGRTSTYGGKWCENETQAGCRDLLVGGMHALDAAGLPLIGSVHDEPIGEAKKGTWSMARCVPLMTNQPAVYAGLPLAIEGHVAPRYRK